MDNQLAQIDHQVWASLSRACTEPKHAWRLPALATQSDSGPRVRTIVLRDVNTDARTLVFHTDKRSPKVKQLQSDNRVSLVFYNHESGLQICVAGTASINTNDVAADEQWHKTPASSRRAYLGPHAPGAKLDFVGVNLPDDVVGRIPTENELEPARENFAILQVVAKQLDWLNLNRDGNTRALFQYSEAEVAASWIAP